jgi:hypothetical protein
MNIIVIYSLPAIPVLRDLELRAKRGRRGVARTRIFTRLTDTNPIVSDTTDDCDDRKKAPKSNVLTSETVRYKGHRTMNPADASMSDRL